MSIEKSNSEKPPAHTDDYYETIASQEEEHLEEGVEKLRERELLISEATAHENKVSSLAKTAKLFCAGFFACLWVYERNLRGELQLNHHA